MLAGHRPARRKGTALGGDALDVAPQFDFLGQQRGTGGAIGGILVVDTDGIAARQLRSRGQGVDFGVNRRVFRLWNVKSFGRRQAYESLRGTNPRAADDGLWVFRFSAEPNEVTTGSGKRGT